MTNVNNSVLKQRLQNKKLFLYLTVFATLAVDLLLTIATIINGVIFDYGQTILAVAVLDVLLVLAVLKSNFRLKYGRWIPVLYAVLTIIFTVALTFLLDGRVYTTTAYYALVIFHGLSAIALIFGMLNSAKLGKAIRFFAFILTTVFLMGSVGYTVFVVTNGVFGQGGFAYRPLEYVYNEVLDGYTATLNSSSKGAKTKVLSQFNGKPVKAISSTLFNDSTLEDIYLECDLDFVIDTNFGRLNEVNSNINLLVAKDKVDELRNKFVSKTREAMVSDEERVQYSTLANMVAPSNLDKDETYVTFDYDLDALEEANYKIIKTWFGKKGDVFDLRAHANDVDYAKDYDLSNEDYLKAKYLSGGKVLSPLSCDGSEIIGTSITKNMPSVKIAFEKIYTVTVGEDNDTCYDLYSEDVEFSKNGALRYVLASDPYNMLGGLKSREGFTNSWQYTTKTNSTKQSFNALSDILSTDVTVYPVWALNAPIISSVNVVGGSNVKTYGDSLTISPTVTAPRNDLDLSYEWRFGVDDSFIGSGDEMTKYKVDPRYDAGDYTVKVKASSSTVTSLESEASKSINITVNRKALRFDWTLPADVYTGTAQSVSASYKEEDVVGSDVITGAITINNDTQLARFSGSVKDAGTYNFTVVLKDNWGDLYTVANPTIGKTIGKKQITLVWDNTTFTYDGDSHRPSTSATGIGDDSDLPLTYNGDPQTDAGEYSVSVEFSDPNHKNNYNINNKSSYTSYKIARRGITLNWSDTASFVYNKTAQGRVVESVENEVADDEMKIIESISYSGKMKDVGIYPITATVGNKNYQVTEGSTSKYTITPKEVTLSWSNTTLTYNGKPQCPTATATNLESDDVCEITASSFTNAGTYTASAKSITNPNYKLPANTDVQFTINKANLTIKANDNTITYGDAPTHNGVKITGFVNNENADKLDDSLDYDYEYSQYGDVGSYEISVSGYTSSNYIIDYQPGTLTVAQRTIKISIEDKSGYVGDGIQPLTASIVGTVVNGDIAFTLKTNATASSPAGVYDITVDTKNSNYNVVVVNSGEKATYTIIAQPAQA